MLGLGVGISAEAGRAAAALLLSSVLIGECLNILNITLGRLKNLSQYNAAGGHHQLIKVGSLDKFYSLFID